MSPVRAPTLLIGVEDFGERAVTWLDAEVRALGDVPVSTVATRMAETREALTDRLSSIVDELLRTRLDRVAVGRLDVAVLGDLAGPHPERIELVLDVVSEVLTGFREALPMPSTAPHQRTASMVAMLGAPSLLTLDDLRPLRSIEEWHEQRARTKALSRVFVLSRQHAGGTLTDEDVLRGVSLLAASTYLAGLRDHDDVASRLQHRVGSDRFALFNVAAADVPVDSVVRYCAWRTALAGADTLHARCASASINGARDLARASLEFDTWVSGLKTGDAARKARTFDSGDLQPVAPNVRDRFGWRETPGAIRAEVAPLIRHAKGGEAPAPLTGPSVDEDTLLALDRAELAQLDDAGARIDRFLEEELAPEHGGRNLPRAAAALDEVEAVLQGVADRPVQRAHPTASAPAEIPDDELEALEEALRRRVSPSRAVITALALGCMAAMVAAAAVITVQAAGATAAPAAGPAAGVTITKAAGASSTSAPWALTGAAVGAALLVGGGWLALRLREQSRAVTEAVQALVETTSRRRRTQPATGSSVALSLRERRLARALLQRVIAARQRVAGLRGAISSLRERARRELRGLGFVAADGQRPEDASEVLGLESPLHRHLVGPEGLERLWRATRQTAEDEHWASELLRAAWPEAGLAHDLPFAPGGAWETVSLSGQHRQLLESSVFGWAEVRSEVRDRLRTFVVQAVDPGVVGLAVAPADEDGVPLSANQRASVVVVAPVEAQGLLDGLADLRYPFTKALATTALSRVVVLRTHPGCSASELEWGVQARELA